MREKFKILFVPFFAIAIVFTIGYNLFYWCLLHFFYPLHYFEPGAMLLSIFLLAWIPVFIWIRPVINLLTLDKRRGQHFAFQTICVFLITLIAHLTTDFTELAVGKLTRLQNINEIHKHPVTKFYTIERCVFLKEYKQVYYTSNTVGRYSKSLTLNVYIVCPVINKNPISNDQEIITYDHSSSGKNKRPSSIDTNIALIRDRYNSGNMYPDTSYKEEIASPPIAHKKMAVIPKVWLCVKYKKKLTEIVYGDRRRQVEDEFYFDCLRQFDKEDFQMHTYLENIDNNLIPNYFQKAAGLYNSNDHTKSVFMLEPRFTPFAVRWQRKLSIALIALLCANAGWLLLILLVKFNSAKLQNFLTHKRK
jgi:hypothetical protein